MDKPKISKKKALPVILVLLTLVILGVIFLRDRMDSSRATCIMNPGLMAPLEPDLKEGLARPSVAVVMGSPQSTDYRSVRIKVTKTLKGDVLKPGDVVDLCIGQVYPYEIKQSKEVILFLRGKDTLDDGRILWVPARTYTGVFVKGNGDQYNMGTSGGKITYTLDEIKRAISNSQ